MKSSRLLLQRDVLAGSVFIAIGLVFGIIGLEYGIGQMRRFMPGFFPVVVSSMLVLIGLGTVVKGLGARDREPVRISPRALVMVASVVLFALLIRPLGLFIAVFVTSVVASLGGYHRFDREAIALAVFLSLSMWVIFVWMLEIPLRMFPAIPGF